MNNDPIVEEVRRTRDKLARQFNYDIHTIFADLRARDRAEDPAHPLVQDASEWTEASATVFNDKPPRQP
ncbi:MAG TPA: hypothetical protein VK742_21750 [Candidatus Sulfotelmatobacter sp.]|jgi:hypothetical protein|nr:hypothetical protein [Candidatus Sulfotelmatobacter sp.]